jgi:hypothetical protein
MSRDQVPTHPTTIPEIMSNRYFEYGVNDKRAGRGFRLAYETWKPNDQWLYERGRAWATWAPRSLKLKRPNGELNPKAISFPFDIIL